MILGLTGKIAALLSLSLIGLCCVSTLASADNVRSVAEEISFEATLPNNSKLGRPLPLAAHWNSYGFSPDYQMKLVDEGHYILPWFILPGPNFKNIYLKYYEKAIKSAAKQHLPISFISTQWESLLAAPPYLNLPEDKNPNVIDVKGKVLDKVSPFGPVEAWHEVGVKWTSTELIKKLQEWYPDPPQVVFVSNNECGKLTWPQVEQSKKYLTKYGPNRDDNFKRKVIGDGWIERYRTLQQGMKDGLITENWKNRSIFVGYDAFGTRAFGRWGGWIEYSLYTPGRLEPWPLAWDGVSVSYYLFNWDPTTDFTVWSPQIESMNWVPMLDEARRINPEFRLELSTWDGHEPGMDSDKRKYFEKIGQPYNPERYEGLVQFGMWLMRPGIVREFRNHLATVEEYEPYFMSVIHSVDRVHVHPILKKYWRFGRLVANKDHRHPYQNNIPAEYKTVDRWFLLDTELDPKHPWDQSTEIPVFSLALVLGEKPNREWLVYAHSPVKNRKDVTITIPGYSRVKIDVAVGGSFYQVIEKNKTVERLIDK